METATGSFVLLHEWVLQWQKMGPCLTSQEKEKIDKCKRQVGKPVWWSTEWEDQIKASLSYISRFCLGKRTKQYLLYTPSSMGPYAEPGGQTAFPCFFKGKTKHSPGTHFPLMSDSSD